MREDAQKRSALVASGRCWAWSVTRDAVKAALDGALRTDRDSPLITMRDHAGEMAPPSRPKVLKWAIRCQTDPTATGVNYETIRAARDAPVKSVRIDGDWRGMVFVPPRSDLYILLSVDHHDAA